MELRKKENKLLRILICTILIVAMSMTMGFSAERGIASAYADEGQPPSAVTKTEKYFGSDCKLTFNSSESSWLGAVNKVTVNGTEYSKASSSFGVNQNTAYYVDSSSSYYILIGEQEFTQENNTVVISATGYKDLTLNIDKDRTTAKIVKDGDSGDTGDDNGNAGGGDNDNNTGNNSELKAAPQATGTKPDSSFDNYNIIRIENDSEYIGNIAKIKVGDDKWPQANSKLSLWGKGYYLDQNSSSIYFDGSNGVLNTGDIITISSEGYKDLTLRVKIENGQFSVESYDNSGNDSPAGPTYGGYTLHVRIAGYFEGAIVGQQKYDAISGASTNVSTNKNSNVTVQVAFLEEGQEPSEDDWENLAEAITDKIVTVNAQKSKVNIDDSCGMIGVYSTYDSSLTLSGTPEKAGTYPVSVTVTDSAGRTATSNELDFRVYTGDEKLIDQLTLENSNKTGDGKYMYNMEPWAIKDFGGTNETVTVPADIKAWYGSHTSGTYGELGYAVSGEPEQTLIIPDGCDLTLVNMKILSSVNIVVEKGGKLNLMDSSVHGNIEVQDGGTFSMNYDSRNDEFLTGSSINGKLILNDGATLENSSIYSNTNFLPNGSEARHNTDPVVVVKGDATIKGNVFIKGDEAATGTDSTTGKSYSGQPAIKIENGTLNITEGSVLAVYGGGKDATTSVGGDAIILDNGTITGDGKLIAVGGNGTFDDGGNAVTGSGTISVKDVYLEGGSSFFPKDETITAGKALGDGVTLANTSNRSLIDGKLVKDNNTNISDTYWSDITETPDLNKYPVAVNGSEDQDQETDNSGNTNNSGSSDQTQSSAASSNATNGSSADTDNSAETGDDMNVTLFIILTIAAMLVAAAALTEYRRRRQG